MKNPNIQENTEKNLKKFDWPLWFPYPSSWLKALSLAIFSSVILFVIHDFDKVGYRLAYVVDSPELFVMLRILLLLAPIPIISFTHHCLNLLISRFIPEIHAPEIGRVKGLLPGIMSWWEGFYGWLVIAISTLIAILFSTIFLPFFNLSYTKIIILYYYTEIQIHNNFLVIFFLFYISTGALIYQIEYLVRCRIISAYSGNQARDASKANNDLSIDKELNSLRGEMGLHQMKSNVLSYEEQKRIINTRRKYENLNKKFWFIFLIFFMALVTYFFVKFVEILPLKSQIYTQIPSKSVLVTPSPGTSESTAVLQEIDTFREGVNKAMNAANLTQSAKSADEWKIVVSYWEDAITLMKSVPSSSPNYAVAQQKIREYQRNLNYAQKNYHGQF